MLEAVQGPDGDRIRALLDRPRPYPDEAVEEVIRLVREGGYVDRTLEAAMQRVRVATDALGVLPASPTREILATLGAALRGETLSGSEVIVWQMRLPRVLTAALVGGALAGAGLGISGALFQRWLGNPLASPDVIGVGFGASAAAIAATMSRGSVTASPCSV